MEKITPDSQNIIKRAEQEAGGNRDRKTENLIGK
jgi:hypothetical protein